MISRRDALRGGLLTAALASSGGLVAAACSPDPETSRAFGISITGSSPADVDRSRVVATTLDHDLRVLNFFVAWYWNSPYPIETLTAIRRHGAVPEITWEPWNPAVGVEQSDYALGGLTRYASYVDEWARAAAEDGEPLYLRFAHEMNSTWYPWSAQANGGTPRDYREAFRWVRSRFDAAGADNVRWVWCPNIDHQDRPDLITGCFPGPDVVDIVATDGYNRGEGSARSLFAATLAQLESVAPGTPMWINEIGCRPGSEQSVWVADAFEYFATTPVETIVWFELDGSDEYDFRLLSNPGTAASARNALRMW